MRFLIFIIGLSIYLISSVSGAIYDPGSLSQSCLQFRGAISDLFEEIDSKAASVSLNLSDPGTTSEEEHTLVASLVKGNPGVLSVSLISPEGKILLTYPEKVGSSDRKTNILAPGEDGNPYFIQSFPESQSGKTGENNSYVYRDLVWPVKMPTSTVNIVMNIDIEHIAKDAAADTGLPEELFIICMNGNGGVYWCSDHNELNSVPPDGVLTEFPTFRDVKELVLHSSSGRAEYDVWNSGGIVRNGAWSTIRFYNDVFKVFVAG